jgi:hypothetical protein
LHGLTLAQREALGVGGLTHLDEALDLSLSVGTSRDPRLKRLGRWRNLADVLDRRRMIGFPLRVFVRPGKLFASMD